MRVTTLPTTGVAGITYIVEPGNVEYIWNGAWVMTASRPLPAPYPQFYKDIPSFRNTAVITKT